MLSSVNVSNVIGVVYICTAFSIIFERQFLCCERHQNTDKASTNDRIYSILELVGQKHRILDTYSQVKEVIYNRIDYTQVKEVLNEQRKRVEDFLTKALKGERNVNFGK